MGLETLRKSDFFAVFLEKQARCLKYFVYVCESLRKYSHKRLILANLLFPLRFLYEFCEKHKENVEFSEKCLQQLQDLLLFLVLLSEESRRKGLSPFFCDIFEEFLQEESPFSEKELEKLRVS